MPDPILSISSIRPIRLKNVQLRFLPASLLGGCALWLSRPTAVDWALGLPLVLAGVALRCWGVGHLVKNEELSLTGPYAHLRHPLYAGTLLIGAGFSLLLGGWIALAMLALLLPWFFLIYFPRKERIEGARLEGLYGESYRTYRRQVPALLPRWRAWQPDRGERSSGDHAQRQTWRGGRFLGNNEVGTWLAIAVGLALFALRAAYAL